MLRVAAQRVERNTPPAQIRYVFLAEALEKLACGDRQAFDGRGEPGSNHLARSPSATRRARCCRPCGACRRSCGKLALARDTARVSLRHHNIVPPARVPAAEA